MEEEYAKADTMNLEALAEAARARAAVTAALAAFPGVEKGEEGVRMRVVDGLDGLMVIGRGLESFSCYVGQVEAATSVLWEWTAAGGGGTRRPSVRTDSVSIYAHFM